MGEQMVEQEAWDPSVLQSEPRVSAGIDLKRFAEMGEITDDEVIDFHYGLRDLSAEPDE